MDGLVFPCRTPGLVLPSLEPFQLFFLCRQAIIPVTVGIFRRMTSGSLLYSAGTPPKNEGTCGIQLPPRNGFDISSPVSDLTARVDRRSE